MMADVPLAQGPAATDTQHPDEFLWFRAAMVLPQIPWLAAVIKVAAVYHVDSSSDFIHLVFMGLHFNTSVVPYISG